MKVERQGLWSLSRSGIRWFGLAICLVKVSIVSHKDGSEFPAYLQLIVRDSSGSLQQQYVPNLRVTSTVIADDWC